MTAADALRSVVVSSPVTQQVKVAILATFRVGRTARGPLDLIFLRILKTLVAGRRARCKAGVTVFVLCRGDACDYANHRAAQDTDKRSSHEYPSSQARRQRPARLT